MIIPPAAANCTQIVDAANRGNYFAGMKTASVSLLIALTVSTALADTPDQSVRRIFLPPQMHIGNAGILPQQPIDEAAWIWHPELAPISPEVVKLSRGREGHFSSAWTEPVSLRFRREFDATNSPMVFHVSADERFELFLDGKRIARGPDRGDVEHWSFASYEAKLAPGHHRMDAVVWRVGPLAPIAQISFRGGFVLKADGEYDKQLTTGKAQWEVQRLSGLSLAPPRDGSIFGVGGEFTAEGCGPQWKEGPAAKAEVIRGPIKGGPYGEAQPGWKLFPAVLPEQTDIETLAGRAVALGSGALAKDATISAENAKNSDLPKWQSLIDGKGEVTVPANSETFVLWDLQNYFAAQPLAEVSDGAGAKITWGWAESLYQPKTGVKGNRDEFIGKIFRGMTDTFLPDGTAHAKFSTHWWRAGRYCLLTIKTADKPLTIHRVALDETRYPIENESSFDCGDPELAGVIKLATRGIQMCSHETFMDCPYYEQLMYDGDSRLEMLTTYAMTPDDRLVRRGIELFDYSRRNWGFVNERYPSFIPQHSPTFSMIWAMILRDHAFWRNDPAFVRARAIGLRSMLEEFGPYVNADGMLENLPGWSFMDWVPTWKTGYAPDGQFGVSALNNLLYVYALQSSAEVEDSLNEPQLAARLRAKAARTADSVRKKFWDEKRGLMADDLAHANFSEHAQCLALLTDTLTGDQAKRAFDGLLTAPDLKRTTIYFSFYLLETWKKFGRGDLIADRLDFWKDLVKQGLKTPVEAPGNTRSDCHAWGSHPLFHLHASIAGIRPASAGFRTVRIEPQPGKWPKIVTHTPHPDGFINLNLKFENETCTGTVELPAAITGAFIWKGKETKLSGGANAIDLRP